MSSSEKKKVASVVLGSELQIYTAVRLPPPCAPARRAAFPTHRPKAWSCVPPCRTWQGREAFWKTRKPLRQRKVLGKIAPLHGTPQDQYGKRCEKARWSESEGTATTRQYDGPPRNHCRSIGRRCCPNKGTCAGFPPKSKHRGPSQSTAHPAGWSSTRYLARFVPHVFFMGMNIDRRIPCKSILTLSYL